mgnify:CR=1 FL=1
MCGSVSRENGKKGGRPKGTKNPRTLAKEQAREEGRLEIQRYMRLMLRSQIHNAIGVGHLMLRNKDGTWRRAPKSMTAEAIEKVLNGGRNMYYIALKDGNPQSFTTLTAYAWDKPKEQPLDVNVHEDLDGLNLRLDAGRDRVAAAARGKRR